MQVDLAPEEHDEAFMAWVHGLVKRRRFSDEVREGLRLRWQMAQQGALGSLVVIRSIHGPTSEVSSRQVESGSGVPTPGTFSAGTTQETTDAPNLHSLGEAWEQGQHKSGGSRQHESPESQIVPKKLRRLF